jgi:hypothetical protein
LRRLVVGLGVRMERPLAGVISRHAVKLPRRATEPMRRAPPVR